MISKILIVKSVSILLLIFFCQPLFSQELSPEILEKIYFNGKAFTKPLKQGQIESLKDVNPSEDTWTYSKLEKYKRNLNSDHLIYGQFIMPSADELHYSYNLFAYDTINEKYYFVAILSFKVIENDVKINHSYLFTEKKSLRDWWRRVFGFYESELIHNIPEKYLFKTCPPPPFKD